MAYLVKQSHRAPAVTSPVPVDESLPRACVIGAGSSGIAAAKQLHLSGIGFDCYELGSDIGGTWVLDNSNGQSACYDTLEINTSCPRMAFSDFPMPADYPAYARARPGARLLRAVRRPLRLRRSITFDTTVEQVTRSGRRPLGRAVHRPDGTETRTYDAVLVANGHHWDARWPEPAYPRHLRRRADPLARLPLRRPARRARRGRGRAPATRRWTSQWSPPACARTTTIVRAPHRVGAAQVPPRQAERPGRPAGLAAVVGDRARLRIRGRRTPAACAKYGLPPPTHQPGQSHPVQSDGIRDGSRADAITPRPGIERLDGDRVVFVDGSSTRRPT